MWDTVGAVLVTIVIFSIVNYFTPVNKTCGECDENKEEQDGR